MKLRIFSSLLILFLAAVLVIGGTMAWFTGKGSPSSVAFLIGTVNIQVTGEEAEPDEFRWEIKEGEDCRDFTWTIKNTGSKRVYLRAWLEETLFSSDESAWAAQENPGETTFPNANNWATYVTYNVGEGTAANANIYPLFAGQYYEAGTIKVWEGLVDDIHTLFVEYTVAGWEMSEAKLAVFDDFNLIPTAQKGANKGNPQVGRFPFKAEFDELVETYTFTIPMKGKYLAGAHEGRDYDWTSPEGDEPKLLFIAAHADLIGIETDVAGMNWVQRECDFHWEYNEDEGYWYYCKGPVAPGDEVSLCLTGCPEKQGIYTVKFYAEAVQAHPEALEEIWPGAPCLQDD